MKKSLSLFILVFCSQILYSLPAGNPGDLRIWFDQPTTLSHRAIWYDSRPDLWIGDCKPVTAGNTSVNPDPEWESQSLPIGNGSIGANIMGSVEAERITFNEKTLWRGGPNTKLGASYYWNVNKQSAPVLEDIRRAFQEGNQKLVDSLTCYNFNGLAHYEPDAEDPHRFGNFTTMGEFYIETGLSVIGMSEYKRTLSLDSALAEVIFCKDDVHYSRSYFVSYPNNVMVARFKADRPGRQNLVFSYMPNPVSTGGVVSVGNDELEYTASLDNNKMEYVVRIKAVSVGGSISNKDGKLHIQGADEVVFLISADTDYKVNFDPDFTNPTTYVGVNPSATTRSWIDEASAMGYQNLYDAHYKDYSSLFQRVNFSLNPDEESIAQVSTTQRIRNYRNGVRDYYLEVLYYQFGRYLLISSSRPGNLPANLQGVWHNNVDGPWRVDYHNNINIQMNYWPACSTNLSECELPLFDFIRTLVKPGTVTARSYFDARGWTASISGNIFGFTAPLSSHDMFWNFNPMAGPWLATHVWNYYDYTRDNKFLKEVGYDLIKSSANFAVDFLWHKPDGTYTAAPSTSPEHGPIDEGATFVHAVIREILHDAISASKVLGVDRQSRKEWQNVLQHLAPYQIGRYGQLMEWSEDIDDPKDEHRHINHLFGLHPGHTISPVTTPQLAQASKVVLEHRGDGATGWSMGWKLNQWARLHDGNHAYTLYCNLLKNGTLDNLWDTHAPFQIDGNFGGTAGVTEMLMQSHMGFIHILPALPDAWQEGSISGLRARGNFEIDINWSNGMLVNLMVYSHSGGKCELRYGDSLLKLNTVKGKRYSVTYEKGKLIVA